MPSRMCHGTLAEPAVHPQSSGAMGEIAYLLRNKGCFGVPGGGVTRFQFLPPQGRFFSNRCEADSESMVAVEKSIAGTGQREKVQRWRWRW